MVDTPSRSVQRKTSLASMTAMRNSPIRTTSLGQGLDKMETLGEPRHNTRRRRSDSRDSLVYTSEDEDDDFEFENMQSPRKHARTSRQSSANQSPVQSVIASSNQNRLHLHHPAARALFPASPNKKPVSAHRPLANKDNNSIPSKPSGRGLLSFNQSRNEAQRAHHFPATAPPGERWSKFDMSGIRYDLPKLSNVSFPSGSSSPPMPSPTPLHSAGPFHHPPKRSEPAVNPLSLSSDRRKASIDSSESLSAAGGDEDEDDENEDGPEHSFSRARSATAPQTMPTHMRGSKQPRDLDADLKKPTPMVSMMRGGPPPAPHLRRSGNSAKPPIASTPRSNPLFASHPLPSPAAKSAIPKSASTLFSASLRGDHHNRLQPDASSSSLTGSSSSLRVSGRRRAGSDASAGAAYLDSLDEDESNDIFAPREPSFAMFDQPTNLFGHPAPSHMSAAPSKSPFLTSTPKKERSELSSSHLGSTQPALSPTRKSTSFDDLLNASTSDLNGSFWTKSTSTPNNLSQAASSRKRNANGAFVSGARVRSQLGLNSPLVASPSSPFIAPGTATRDDDHTHYLGIEDDSRLMIPESPSWRDMTGSGGPPSSIPALTDSSSIASSLASSRDSSRMSLRSSVSSNASSQNTRHQQQQQHHTFLMSEPMVRRPSDTFSEGNTSLKDVKPLASAFESHGLISKKGRYPRDSGVALDASNFSFTSTADSSAIDLSHSAIFPAHSLMQSTKTMPGTPCKPSASILPNDLKLSKNRRKSGLSTQITSPMVLDSPDSSPAKPDGMEQASSDDSPSKDSAGRESTPSASPCMQNLHHRPAAAVAKKVQDTPSHSAIRRPGPLFRRRSSGQIKDDMPTFGRSASMAGERADSTDDEPMTPVRGLNKNGLFIKVPPPLVASPRKTPTSANAAVPQQGGPSSDECTTPITDEFQHSQKESRPKVTFASGSGQRPALAPKTIGRPTHPPSTQHRPNFRTRHSGSSVVTLRQLQTQGPERFESNYQVQGILGSGISSEAFAVYNLQSGEYTAVKRIRGPTGGAKERARRLEEVDILRQLTKAEPHNPFIIELRDAWEQSGQLYIETELCDHGNLAQYLNAFGNEGRLDEARQWKIAYELCSAVAFIHHHQMLHLDIKPANVFISQTGGLKLGDFGLATRWPKATHFEVIHGSGVDVETSASSGARSRPRAKSIGVGTLDLEREGDREYIAPEVLRGLYGKPADVFSLGLSLLEAVANIDMPGNGLPWHKLRSDDYSDVNFDGTTPQLIGLIQGLLKSDHEERLSAAQALQTPVLLELHHRFEHGNLHPALVEEDAGFVEDLLKDGEAAADTAMELEDDTM